MKSDEILEPRTDLTLMIELLALEETLKIV